MKKAIYLILLLIICYSCEEEKIIFSEPADSTVIMFYPWSTNLKPYFDQNIKDFGAAVAAEGLDYQRVLVCIETQPNQAEIIELKSVGDSCINDTLLSFSNTQFTTEGGLTRLFTKIQTLSKTDTYSMIVGCHGMGWLPIVDDDEDEVITKADYDQKPITRYFGGLSNEYKIEIGTLAQGLSNAGLNLEYILFDDCYMSSIEVAYELKDVTHYLIACPTEIMAYGFPYHMCGKYLLGVPDYYNVCKAFYNFYRSYESPYGTIAVTDCTQISKLAKILQTINKKYTTSTVNLSSIQQMDGYTPTIFYDLEDVVRKKCTNSTMFSKFQTQLAQTVPYCEHTSRYYSASKGAQTINTFCGITTSEVSTNELATSVSETGWYIATH